jgi:acetyl esterase/lipase
MAEVIRRGLEYSSAPGDGGEPLLLDLYTPDGVARPPLVVWMHGGGFVSGDRVRLPDTLSPGSIFGALTSAGFACASIDYRLAPPARYPEPVRNVRAAIGFLLEHAPRYGYDAERLGVWGESAGGLLALTAAMTIPQVRVVVAWYSPTDILALPVAPGEEERELALFGAPAKAVSDLAAEASPISHVTEAAPPCLLVHGDADGRVPVSQSLRMHDRLLDVGADSSLRIVPGADHCFENYADVSALISESVDFLASRLQN